MEEVRKEDFLRLMVAYEDGPFKAHRTAEMNTNAQLTSHAVMVNGSDGYARLRNLWPEEELGIRALTVWGWTDDRRFMPVTLMVTRLEFHQLITQLVADGDSFVRNGKMIGEV